MPRTTRLRQVKCASVHLPSQVGKKIAGSEAGNGQRRPSLVYCGDDEDAKEITARLIRDVDFDPVDAGPLEVARYTEPFTLLMAKLAYETDDTPALAYRFERFEKLS